jgi:hypothetical protein
MEIREKLEQIETEISETFSKLLKQQGTFNCNTIEDLEEEIDYYFEMRNDITGNVFDVAILSISSKGIRVVETDDFEREHLINFYDLSSTEQRLSLVERMELYIIEEEKRNSKHNKLREILQEYGCEEFGDCIIDDICNIFDFPTTTFKTQED